MKDPWKIFAVGPAALAFGWGVSCPGPTWTTSALLRAELADKANREAVAHLEADVDFRRGVIREKIKEIRRDVKQILEELRKANGYRN